MRSIDDEARTCIKCKNELPLSEFRRNPFIESGYDIKCKMCSMRDRWKYIAHLNRQYREELEGVMSCH